MSDATSTMHAEGSGPLDPYRTLQLHPDAPRDLIDESYWLLASDVRGRAATGASRAALADLNEAYALLSDEERRARYDQEYLPDARKPSRLARRKRRTLFVISRNESSPRLTHYDLLCVDRAADMRVVELAYRLLKRTDTYRHPGPARDQLDAAYGALTDHERRAKYDSSLGRVAPVRAPEHIEEGGDDLPEPAVVPSAVAAEEAEALEEIVHADPPVESTPASEPDTSEPVELQAVPAPIASAVPQADDPELNETPIEDVPRDQPPSPEANRASARTRGGNALLQWVRGVYARASEREQPAPGFPAPAGSRSYDDVVESVREQSQAMHERLATERLAGLRDDAIAPRPLAPHAPAPSIASRARIEFLAGPRTGSSVGFDGGFVLGGEDQLSRDVCRIAFYGDRFVLHGAAETPVVNGRRLSLPLVILDDADEIRIGQHSFRFRIGAAEPSDDADTGSGGEQHHRSREEVVGAQIDEAVPASLIGSVVEQESP